MYDIQKLYTRYPQLIHMLYTGYPQTYSQQLELKKMARDYKDYIKKSIVVDSLSVLHNTWFTPLASQVWTDSSVTNLIGTCITEAVGRGSSLWSPSGFGLDEFERRVIFREQKVVLEDTINELHHLVRMAIQVKSDIDTSPENIKVVYQIAGVRALQVTNVTSTAQIVTVLNEEIAICEELRSYIPKEIMDE